MLDAVPGYMRSLGTHSLGYIQILDTNRPWVRAQCDGRDRASRRSWRKPRSWSATAASTQTTWVATAGSRAALSCRNSWRTWHNWQMMSTTSWEREATNYGRSFATPTTSHTCWRYFLCACVTDRDEQFWTQGYGDLKAKSWATWTTSSVNTHSIANNIWLQAAGSWLPLSEHKMASMRPPASDIRELTEQIEEIKVSFVTCKPRGQFFKSVALLVVVV